MYIKEEYMIRKYFKLKRFAEWVAYYIFACDCEDDVFAELACRKLKDLGMVGIVKCRGPVYENYYVLKQSEDKK